MRLSCFFTLSALLCATTPVMAAFFRSPLSYFRQQPSAEAFDPSFMETSCPGQVFDPSFLETSCPVQDFTQFDTSHRTVFERGEATVRGFLSAGGILMLPLDAAIASHLDLPRFSPVKRAASADEEDAFCDRLRLLGAKWWSSEDDYMQKMVGMQEFSEEQLKALVVGWPNAGGGVWVLRASTAEELPKEIYMLNLCVNMGERCELLERWGATFYENPMEVPEFAHVLGAAAA